MRSTCSRSAVTPSAADDLLGGVGPGRRGQHLAERALALVVRADRAVERDVVVERTVLAPGRGPDRGHDLPGHAQLREGPEARAALRRRTRARPGRGRSWPPGPGRPGRRRPGSGGGPGRAPGARWRRSSCSTASSSPARARAASSSSVASRRGGAGGGGHAGATSPGAKGDDDVRFQRVSRTESRPPRTPTYAVPSGPRVIGA